MDRLPSKANERGSDFTVADFLEAGRERLGLSLVAGGGGLGHGVLEPIVNRPGLALTGFYEHFPWERLQLIGNAERAYLCSLDDATRISRFRALIEQKAYCFIFTTGHVPFADEIAVAEEAGAVILATEMETRHFAHHSAFVLEELGSPRTSIYGTMIEVAGLGVLIEGAPGLGKSETALGLIKHGCALIADDLTCIRKQSGANELYGSASDSTAGYMEIRGIGIIHIPSIFGINAIRREKQLQLVVSFRLLDDVRGEIDRIGQTRHVKRILDVDVPNVIIPVSEGRDLVNLVETAAQQQRLVLSGYDPVEELSERLRRRADVMECKSAVSKTMAKRKGK